MYRNFQNKKQHDEECEIKNEKLKCSAIITPMNLTITVTNSFCEEKIESFNIIIVLVKNNNFLLKYFLKRLLILKIIIEIYGL